MKKEINIDGNKILKITGLIGLSIGIAFGVICGTNEFYKDHYLEFRSPVQSPIVIKQREVVQVEEVEEKVEEIEEVEAAIEVEETEQVVWKTGTVSAYSCGGITTEAERQMNCPNGVTATGVKPQVGMMACDRANLGKTFYIEGYGELTCTDTGGSIKGQGRFDIYLDTIQEAREFGVKHLAYKEELKTN